jgi:predicted nucleotidyltransferase
MNLEKTLRVLYDADVEFVLIGGAAMGLQGSAHLTKDMDFCYERSRPNRERLAKALKPYHPVLRGAPPGLPFQFDAETISRGLNFTLTTDLGDIDFLAEVSGIGGFSSVKAASDIMHVGGVEVRVLSLAGLIKSKTAAGRSRDLYVLPELKALEELKKKTHSE